MRKQTKRKVYGLYNPITMAIAGAAVSNGPEVQQLDTGESSALESLRTGKAVEEEVHLLTVMTAISAVLAYKKRMLEPRLMAQQAFKALDSIKERNKRTGKWGASGEELAALREMYQYHDAQRAMVARSEYEKAVVSSKEVLQNPVRRQKVLYGKEKP